MLCTGVTECSVCTGVTECSVCTGVTECSVCTGVTECSVYTAVTVQCMYWCDRVQGIYWCDRLQCIYWSNTTLFGGGGVYVVLLHKVQLYVSALENGHLQVVHEILSKYLYETFIGLNTVGS